MAALPLAALALAGCLGAPGAEPTPSPPPAPTAAPGEQASKEEAPQGSPGEPPPRHLRLQGNGTVTFVGACTGGTCAGAMEDEVGSLDVPFRARDVLLAVSWDSPAPALSTWRVSLAMTSPATGPAGEAEGPSPLHLRLAEVPAGAYRLRATPSPHGGAAAGQAFAWELTGQG